MSDGRLPGTTSVTTRTSDGVRGVEPNPNRTAGSTGARPPHLVERVRRGDELGDPLVGGQQDPVPVGPLDHDVGERPER
jgi:hypothetical protein